MAQRARPPGKGEGGEQPMRRNATAHTADNGHSRPADEINRARTSRTIPTQPLLEEITRRRDLALDASARAQHGKGARTAGITLADAYDLQASALKDIIHWVLETEGATNAQA